MKKKNLSVIANLLATCTLLTACGGVTQPVASTEQTEPMKNIYQKTDPAEDDTLNVLMIGASFCYYYTDELWGMLDSAGIKARICNVYYSGCSIQKHWTWWKNNEANYDFIVVDEKGRHETNLVNLEYCLAQYNWDIISWQEAPTQIRTEGVQQHLLTTKTARTELWGYIMEQFPMSRYFWHQTWASQVGYDRNGYKMETAEQQQGYHEMIRDFAVAVSEEHALTRVPSGEAWQLARANPAVGDILCNRLKDGGDFYHDGDIGGGQYLNACTWFEVITGQSCIGNTFRPNYSLVTQDMSLSEEMVTALQESAHQAVAEATS